MTTIRTAFLTTSVAAVLLALSGPGELNAQPVFGNPSPTAGTETSQRANATADVAAYKEVDYLNKGVKGPALVVIPGEIKSNMQVGKLKTTQWVIKFDILKAEQIAENKQGFDGRPVGNIIGLFGGLGGAVAGTAACSVQTQDQTDVWIIGMRYKIMDANTTEQVAQGYKELKMEVGATATSVLGVSQGAKGGVGLDTMVQRLVQTTVYEIDSKHK